MPLKDLVDRQYGVKTDIRVNPLVSAIQTTPTELLKPNPNRLAWTLINLGTHHLYIAFSPDVSSSKGIYIAANGGVLGVIWNEDFLFTTFPAWGIADTAACNIYYLEVIEI